MEVAGAVEPYAAIAITIVMVLLVTAGMLALAHLIGPRRHGPVKDSAYESGMPIAADARRRVNIRFYMVAILFLLFDVEVALMWPWATAFYHTAMNGTTVPLEGGGAAGKGFLLAGMGLFVLLLVFGLFYEWKKGAFQWE